MKQDKDANDNNSYDSLYQTSNNEFKSKNNSLKS